MIESDIKVAMVESTPFAENCYIVYQAGAKTCAVIDPGLEPERIIAFLQENNLTPEAILVTHGHADHVGGIPAIKDKFPECRILICEDEKEKLGNPETNLTAMFGFDATFGAADGTFVDGDAVEVAGLTFNVRAVPGHSSGHVVFVLQGAKPPIVFVGDVIFAGGVGRTDFPDGDHATLMNGIRDRIYTLPDDTVLAPGHGPSTSVAREKRTNPFVQASE
jgi:hydroxyacylglutathione hydrolase